MCDGVSVQQQVLRRNELEVVCPECDLLSLSSKPGSSGQDCFPMQAK